MSTGAQGEKLCDLEGGGGPDQESVVSAAWGRDSVCWPREWQGLPGFWLK